MKAVLLFFFFLPVCYVAFSQQNILDKRSKLKNRMEKFYLENKRTYSLTETSKTLTYTLTDSLSLPATYVYYFNNQNRCEKEETIYSCDSCLQIGITQTLNNKFVNWKKVGPESYYAGFPYNTLLEKIKINDQFILRYTWMKRKDVTVID